MICCYYIYYMVHHSYKTISNSLVVYESLLPSMTRISISTVLLVALVMFYYVFHYFTVEIILYLAVITAVATATIMSLRATIVIWITVLVLLSFAGNRRKSLVRRGRQITFDVVWHLVRVSFRSHKR
ncbi:unnamed protein product [Lathyrus oleraceus]